MDEHVHTMSYEGYWKVDRRILDPVNEAFIQIVMRALKNAKANSEFSCRELKLLIAKPKTNL